MPVNRPSINNSEHLINIAYFAKNNDKTNFILNNPQALINNYSLFFSKMDGNCSLRNSQVILLGDNHVKIEDNLFRAFLIRAFQGTRPGSKIIILHEGYSAGEELDRNSIYAQNNEKDILDSQIRHFGWDDINLINKGLNLSKKINQINRQIARQQELANQALAKNNNVSLFNNWQNISNLKTERSSLATQEENILIDQRNNTLMQTINSLNKSGQIIFVIAGSAHFNDNNLRNYLNKNFNYNILIPKNFYKTTDAENRAYEQELLNN